MKIFVYSILLAFAPFIVAGEGNLRGDDKRDVNRILQDPLPLPPPFGTLDNLPPPLENICDQYTDTEAHGLCIAYCEAKDCDSIPHSTSPRADNKGVQKSCANLKTKFQDLTGQSPPCERCPCWEISDFEPLLSATSDLDQCGPYIPGSDEAIIIDGDVPDIGFMVFDVFQNICVTYGPHTAGNFLVLRRLTADEKATCFDQIIRFCQNL